MRKNKVNYTIVNTTLSIQQTAVADFDCDVKSVLSHLFHL
jgi:hypothetical protein